MKVPISFDQAKAGLDAANRRYDDAEMALVKLRKDKTATAEAQRIALRAIKAAAYENRCYFRDACERIEPTQHRYSFSTR